MHFREGFLRLSILYSHNSQGTVYGMPLALFLFIFVMFESFGFFLVSSFIYGFIYANKD